MAKQILGGDIVLYIKRGIGPEFSFQYEGCAEYDDADLAPGDLTPVTCPSNALRRESVVIDIGRGDGGLKTTTIRLLLSQAQWLMEQGRACDMTVDFRFGTCGRPDNPDDWTSILRFSHAIVQPASVNTGAGKTDPVRVGANVAGQSYSMVYELTLDQSDVGSYGGLDGVLAIGDAECSGECGPGFSVCDYVFVATEGEYLDTAEIIYTDDGGSTWTAFATSPFGAGESICRDIVGRVSGSANGTSMRLIVFRGSTDGANPAECAITVDWGATWTNVEIGAVNGQYITAADMRGRKIWAGADDGDMYYSADDGATWTRQSTGTVATQINSIDMYSDSIGMAVCNTDQGLYTTDGSTWSALGDVVGGSDPNLMAVSMVTEWIAYVAAGTAVYYTTDRGTTWTLLQTIGYTIQDLVMWNDSLGYLLANADVYRTVDGVTFNADTSTPTNAILRKLSLCSGNQLWAVGQTAGDLDMAVHGQPQPATSIF